jgi:hypothetical protein
MASSFETIRNFNMIQTFYADPEAVNRSGEVHLTSIALYFKNIPDSVNNVSGMVNPKVTVMICDVENNEPVLSKVYTESRVTHASYKNAPQNIIQAFPPVYDYVDATTPTVFSFAKPLRLRTDRFYGIVVILDDPAFELWTNVNGDRLVGTNTPSGGSPNIKDGKLFQRNNSGVFVPISYTDLKCAVRIAKFNNTNVQDIFTPRGVEFFGLDNVVGNFIGGEKVFQRTANSTGNITFVKGNNYIFGTGTSFDSHVVGDPIVVHANSTYAHVTTIGVITNSTVMIVDNPVPFTNSVGSKYEISPAGTVSFFHPISNILHLKDSTANSTIYFTSNSTVVGADSRASARIASLQGLSLDRVKIKGDAAIPPGGTLQTRVGAAARSGNSFSMSTAQFLDVRLNAPTVTDVTQYDGWLLSRSLEVQNASLYSNTDFLINRTSMAIQANLAIDLSTTNLFQTPSLPRGSVDVFAVQNLISNSSVYLEANSSSRNYLQLIDTEVNGTGIAAARHISKKVTFQTGRFAEDIRMFITAYRPLGTDIKIYARVHNSQDPEAFDDKAWTPMNYVINAGAYSSSEDKTDFIEYELGMPQYSESANTFPGTLTTEMSNSTLVAYGGDPTTYFQQNDIVKVYNPLIPQDYIVGVVNTVSSTTVVLGNRISNTNLVGTGFKIDRLKYPFIAFNNITHDNVARYYSSSLVEYDKFDTMQIKIVMTSNTTYLAPKVDQIQVIGVSA